MSANTQHPRAIRSFVTRSGRTTAAQQRALEQLWPKYGVGFEARPLDLRATFAREGPCVLEIGFGNGANLVALAAQRPECNFLGVEVHRPGIGRLMLELEAAGLPNVRVICHDAAEVVAVQLGEGMLEEILVLFPDPWPKKRHHKRRLIRAPFAALLASRLRAGGVLRIATDWQPYALEMLETLTAVASLENLAAGGAFVPHPDSRVPTRFEQRGARLGHLVWDLAFRRRAAQPGA